MQNGPTKIRIERVYWSVLIVALVLASILTIIQIVSYFQNTETPYESNGVSKEEMLRKLSELRESSNSPPPSQGEMRGKLQELRAEQN